ncbi:MAG: homoserine dehydrogenase, partial [Elusimicrobiota bacterium]|nr:homoserine dehydrogenase [Elusimicrobiota bacterium]
MNDQKKVNIGIIGLGTVGKGVLKILNNIENIISTKTGGEIIVRKIVNRTLNKNWASYFNFDFDFYKTILSDNVDDVLDDPEIDIVVELIGGYEPARIIIVKALENKKHVVTANKAVLAKYWDEINAVSKKNNVLLYFEASVGAGIPIIQGLNEGLASNKIEMICGILNGTTNYILTKMLNDKINFSDALKMAQEKGFAESDPTFDIKGIDSVHKLAILASLAYHINIDIDSIYKEGIDEIKVEDVDFAYKELGLVLKLLAIAKKTKNGLELRVQPVFISKKHLLASVENEFNAVYIIGDATGEIMFYGKGAGELPAASGVVSDILYVAKHINNETANKTQFVSIADYKRLNILDIDEVETCYYFRFEVSESPGALAQIAGILGRHKVSIASCYQHENIY